MIEVSGDSSREGCWALVRLRIDGERIVDADADGLDADLRGLSLLEAAAVGGETLAVDALANALGPVFRARRPGPRRGGDERRVDCAVALLRAGPEAVGVTLRLWTDPEGQDSERACCSPEAVIAARETCHRLGLPHVTLDLREAFRRAVVEPFVRGYARGETPNPCTRCNGGFRFAELLAFARRAGALGWRRATTRGSSSTGRAPARARRGPGEGPVLHARAARPCEAGPGLVPARRADEGPRRARRQRAAGSRLRAARRARRHASSPATTTAPSSSAAAWSRETGRSWTRQGVASARTRVLALHAGPAARAGRRRRPAALRAGDERGHEHRRRRPARVAGPDTVTARGGCTCRSSASRPRCATARRRSRRRRGHHAGFRLDLDEPAYGVAAARPRSSTRATSSSARARLVDPRSA